MKFQTKVSFVVKLIVCLDMTSNLTFVVCFEIEISLGSVTNPNNIVNKLIYRSMGQSF